MGKGITYITPNRLVLPYIYVLLNYWSQKSFMFLRGLELVEEPPPKCVGNLRSSCCWYCCCCWVGMGDEDEDDEDVVVDEVCDANLSCP